VQEEDVSDGPVRAYRARLAEEIDGAYWVTTLLAMEECADRWMWVDVEWASDEAFGRAPAVGAPRLARSLLDRHATRLGPVPLRPEPTITRPGDLQALGCLLTDAQRTVPIAVFTPERREQRDAVHAVMARAKEAAARAAGLVDVRVLTHEAVEGFNRAVGEGLEVSDGALRIYLPGLDPMDPRPWRHRYVGLHRLGHRPAVAGRTVLQLVAARAAGRRPPLLYRERVRALLGHRQPHAADMETALALAEEAQRDLESATAQVETLTADMEERLIEVYEAQQEAAGLRARVRHLELRLAEAGTPAWSEVPEPAIPETASSCEGAISLAKRYLQRVAIADSATAGAQELDEHPDPEVWADRAWRSLRALDCYASDKVAGFKGDFSMWCRDSGSIDAVPTTWVAMAESDSTVQNERFFRARVLQVDPAVAPSGEVYMPAHIRIGSGGHPAPRLHFHDDTLGATGRIHVGHLGPHLLNSQTN
jgi:hypothetical protein